MKIRALMAWLSLESVQPDVAVAQFRGLQRQAPLLYLLLGVNAAALAYTHRSLAPAWMSVAIPAALLLVCASRILFWMRQRNRRIEAAEAVRHLRRITVLAALIAAVYVWWSLSLNLYGGPYEQGHVALFIAITVVGCIFCLIHLPQAALTVTAVVTVPYLVYYLQADNPVFVAVAMNIFLVTAVMVQVLLNSYRGFAQLVGSRAETERLNQENLRLAHTDALTGLPNRRHFFAELGARVEAARADGTRFAVGVLDLDLFKPVNDTYGHAVGDRLLEQVGQRLRNAAEHGVVAARLGGDEFGFLVAADGAAAEEAARRVRDAVAAVYGMDEMTIAIGCSCGVAIYPDAGRTAHELFDRSDYALYASKASGRGTVTVYSAEHEARVRSERAIEAALQTADLDAEIELHFQPIVDASGATVALEALARWNSPTLGKVRPDVFVTVAERTGFIHALTLALFRKSLAELGRFPPNVALSFNLSAHDVTSPQTVLAIVAIVRQAGVDPSRIMLELTETAVMRDFEAAADSIRLLRSLGVKIALDDFGAGYSSLGCLHRLPIDRIKIDRSFVRGVLDPAGRNLLASILALGAAMGLDCVAEGVEEPEQLAALEALGWRMFQGYLFAAPMPIGDALAWVEAKALARTA